jgi:hypothetical protein
MPQKTASVLKPRAAGGLTKSTKFVDLAGRVRILRADSMRVFVLPLFVLAPAFYATDCG